MVVTGFFAQCYCFVLCNGIVQKKNCVVMANLEDDISSYFYRQGQAYKLLMTV